MSVYNGGPQLRETLDSVLSQTGVSLEFVIVDDGSRDETAAFLAEAARQDPRVRVITQDNAGLTRALMVGCEAARAPLIARQDAGDLSLPGRLAAQVSLFAADPDLVMAACNTRFVGPAGEFLNDVVMTDAELGSGLAALGMDAVRGPPAGAAVMFRRDAYIAAGGFRAPFRVAQDLDLWMRLYELGRCRCAPVIGYVVELAPGAISSDRRDEQVASTEVILQCAAARRTRNAEAPLLEAFARRKFPKKQSSGRARRRTNSAFYYHIATRLIPHNCKAASHYLQLAVRLNPLNLKAALHFAAMALRG